MSINGLLRQYLRRAPTSAGTAPKNLIAIAAALSNRPRKTVGWTTPAEALNEQLLLLQATGVASTS
jgi:IS30 family transposase